MSSDLAVLRIPDPSEAPLRPLLLCIDDDESVLECMTSLLEKYEYRSLSASGGLLGIRLFKEYDVDLVILDYDMPGMNGREVAEELRRLNSKVPIIMSSGTQDVSARVGSLVDAYISKGAEFNSLLAAIAKLTYVPARGPAEIMEQR
jgi:DNA-binding response OmpR family regulator